MYNGTFRYWCAHVLPQVYDDSLSYYELLNKVVKYLNNCIEDINELKQLIDITDSGAIQIVKNFAELKKTTAPLVLVVKNDSKATDLNRRSLNVYSDDPMGDGGPCWFWTYINNTGVQPIYGGYQREDESYVFAMPNQGPLPGSNAPMSSIMRVFASYYNRANLIYGRTNTLFNPNIDRAETLQIDCSDLAAALLYGIDYNNSRYVSGNSVNVPGEYRAMQLPSSRFAQLPYITEIVEYMAEHKRLFTIPAGAQNPLEASGMMPGDFLITSSQDTSSEFANGYLSAAHLSLVVKTYPENGYVLVAHATSGSGLFTQQAVMQDVLATNEAYKDRAVRFSILNINAEAGLYYQAFFRPDYGAGNQSGKNISGIPSVASLTVETLDVDDNNLGLIRPSCRMKPGKAYTLIARGVLPEYSRDNNYIWLKVAVKKSGSLAYIDIRPAYHCNTGKNVVSIPFILPADDTITDVYSIVVKVHVGPDGSTGKTYQTTELGIVEGYCLDAAGSIPIAFTVDNDFPETVTNYSYTDPDGKEYVYLIFDNPDAADDYTIGSLAVTPGVEDCVKAVSGINPDGTAAAAKITVGGSVSWTCADTTTGSVIISGYLT